MTSTRCAIVMLEGDADLSVRHVVVTVPDWIADPDGLFVADFDLLARIARPPTIDIVCTEAVLGSGFHERLHGWWPGLDELDGHRPGGREVARVRPTLVTPLGRTGPISRGSPIAIAKRS